MRSQLTGKLAVSDIEKARFVQSFCSWKTVLNIVRIRNRNQNFSKVGTATATNHCGSTTLTDTVYEKKFRLNTERRVVKM